MEPSEPTNPLLIRHCLVPNTTNKHSHCLRTANNDRKSKGEESDVASVVIHTYRNMHMHQECLVHVSKISGHGLK